jgi:hypothetical protein
MTGRGLHQSQGSSGEYEHLAYRHNPILHGLFGIFWLGVVLTIDFLVIPAAQSLPAAVG